jgi:nucleotide-binding universal stress UspA family protein
MSAENAAAPVLFAYDGSSLAKRAIEQAGELLDTGRRALVLTVWQPFDVGFIPAGGQQFDAAEISEVRRAAGRTAAEGASLADAAGFRAESLEIEASPTWKGIVDVAERDDAALIVLGSHRRHGLTGVLAGSVAACVTGHSRRSVLIVHRRED